MSEPKKGMSFEEFKAISTDEQVATYLELRQMVRDCFPECPACRIPWDDHVSPGFQCPVRQ